jgi:hypothetical protein
MSREMTVPPVDHHRRREDALGIMTPIEFETLSRPLTRPDRPTEQSQLKSGQSLEPGTLTASFSYPDENAERGDSGTAGRTPAEPPTSTRYARF